MQSVYVCFIILSVATVTAFFTLPPVVRCWHTQYSFDLEHNIYPQESKLTRAFKTLRETIELAPIATCIALLSVVLITLTLKTLLR